jgi:hypothetical protein
VKAKGKGKVATQNPEAGLPFNRKQEVLIELY